jgi:hypothetical protein
LIFLRNFIHFACIIESNQMLQSIQHRPPGEYSPTDYGGSCYLLARNFATLKSQAADLIASGWEAFSRGGAAVCAPARPDAVLAEAKRRRLPTA